MGDLITTSQAARELGCFSHQLCRLADMLEFAGRLKVERIARIRLFQRSDLPLLAEELEKRPTWRRRLPVPATAG